MINFNMTPGAEKDVIWIVRINMDGSYMYFSTEFDKLTLDGIDFDGKVIDYPSEMEEGIVNNAVDGGNISIVSNFSFSIKRYNDYSGASNFFNDFFPATSKPLLTSKAVDVGIIWRWSGDAIPVPATSLNQITWKKQYYIQQPKCYHDRIECFCVELDELASTQLPYYTIQKEEDNGISYFANAPKESYGQTIPIVYGDFSLENLEYSDYSLSPAVRTHVTDNNFIMSSHICHTVDSQYLFKYLDGAKTVMKIDGVTYSGSNARKGYRLSLSTNGSIITGELMLQFGSSINDGLFTGVSGEAFDNDSTTYAVVNSLLALKLISTLSETELGLIPYASGNVIFKTRYRSESGTVTGKLEWYDAYYGNNDATKLSGTNVGNSLSFSITTTETVDAFSFGTDSYVTGWKIEDIQNNYCCLTNVSANLRLINAFLHITNIQVYDKRYSKWIPKYIKTWHGYIPAAPQWIRDFNPIDFGHGAIFSKIKGYIYEYWID